MGIAAAHAVVLVKQLRKKAKTGGRAEMKESAMYAADLELEASTAHPEETTSQKLLSHLFEACNILRGPSG